MMKRILKIYLPLFLPALFLFSGCSVWHNFTAYFNVYYNASNIFEDAESELLKQKKELFPGQSTAKVPTSSNQNFNKVIEKLSKLLQFSTKSSLVDNALLMVGKSFYYQQDYQKALRKFTELITTFPNSDLSLEARLWVAKTQFKLKNYSQAISILEQVKQDAAAEDENKILTDAYIESAGYMISVESYKEAITEIENLIKVSDDDAVKAEAMYELGKLYVKQDQLENAARAFARVLDYSPRFEVEYRAKLEYGIMKRELGSDNEALDIFKDIRKETNYNEFLDQTELQIGISLSELKRFDEAFRQLTFVDTSYKQTSSAAVAEFHLAEMMETAYGNYDSATVYYKKSAGHSALPTDYYNDATQKVKVLTEYQRLRKEITKNTKQLVYSLDTNAFKQDSIAFRREQARLDSIKALNAENIEDNQENTSTASGRSVRGRGRGDISREISSSSTSSVASVPVRPTISADSIRTLLSKSEYELGGLFFTELNIPDSSYYYYTHILENYKYSPYIPQTLYALGSYYLTKGNKEKADSLFNVVYENYSHASIVNAAADKLGKPLINLRYDPAEELYVAAERKLENGNYNEALKEFFAISKTFPKSMFAPKALYAGGWVLENKLNKPDSAAAVYDSISVHYPASAYSNAVRPKLSAFKAEQNRIQAQKDSVTNAKKAIADSLAGKQPKITVPSDTTRTQEKVDVASSDSVSDDTASSANTSDRDIPEEEGKENVTLQNPKQVSSDSTGVEPKRDPSGRKRGRGRER